MYMYIPYKQTLIFVYLCLSILHCAPVYRDSSTVLQPYIIYIRKSKKPNPEPRFNFLRGTSLFKVSVTTNDMLILVSVLFVFVG